MGWSERRYEQEDRWHGNPARSHGALFWLLGVIVGAHVLKVILVGTKAVPITGTWFDGRMTPWFSKWFGTSPHTWTEGFVWQPLTYQLVHAGMGHLFWNGLSLFIIGRILEPMIGPRRLIICCFSFGAVGALGVFLPGGGGGPTIGISGGISGLWMLAWCLAPNLPLNLIFFVARLKYVAGFFLLMDFLRAMGDGQSAFGSATGVAYWVHLMGAVGAFVYAFLWPRFFAPRFAEVRQQAKHRKEVASYEQKMSDERELDRILDKINREGMPSLTEGERTFLRQSASRYSDS